MNTLGDAITGQGWPAVILGAWIVTAVLNYAIVRTAINKSNTQDLPQVLAALTPLLRILSWPFGRVLGQPADQAQVLTPPAGTSETEQSPADDSGFQL